MIRMSFQMQPYSFVSKMVFRQGVKPDLGKIKALIDVPLPNIKKDLQSFLVVFNYSNKFSTKAAEMCKPMRNLHQSNQDEY